MLPGHSGDAEATEGPLAVLDALAPVLSSRCAGSRVKRGAGSRWARPVAANEVLPAVVDRAGVLHGSVHPGRAGCRGPDTAARSAARHRRCTLRTPGIDRVAQPNSRPRSPKAGERRDTLASHHLLAAPRFNGGWSRSSNPSRRPRTRLASGPPRSARGRSPQHHMPQ